MTTLQSFILSCMDVLMFVVFAMGILKQREYKEKIWLVIGFMLLTFGVSQLVPGALSPVINIALMFLLTMVLFGTGVMQTIYTVLLVYVMIVSFQSLIAYLLNAVGYSIEYSFAFGIVLQVLTFISVMLFVKLAPLETITRYISKNNKVYKAILFNGFTFVMLFLVYWRLNITGIVEHMIMFSLSSMIMITLNFVVIQNGLVDEYQQKELELYKKYLPVVEELMSEIRSRQHNYNNQIQALTALMTHQELAESLRHYTKGIELDDNLSQVLRWSNQILAGLLYSKFREAEKKGLKIHYDFNTFQFPSDIEDYDAVEMVSILIDNAIEASLENRGDIWVETETTPQHFGFYVMNQNPFISPKEFDLFFKRGYSTKSAVGRGFGMYNLKRLVGHYKGTIEFENRLRDRDNHIRIGIKFLQS